VGAVYLRDMADLLRLDPFPVVELDGWKTRARRSGGYDYGPWFVCWHHTASSGNGKADAEYCTFTSPVAPITNIVIGRDGTRYVCAGGATNTEGKGGPLTLPDGRVVPADGGNTRALSIEISNNGVGMPYPQTQIDACFATSNRLTLAYCRGRVDNIAQHHDYAPNRKIDPSTAAAVQGPWRPSAINTSGSWELYDLRNEARRRATPPAPTPPPQPLEEADMEVVEIRPTDANAVFLGHRTTQATPVRSGAPDGLWRFILWVEWVDGRDPAQLLRLQAYRDCGAPVHSLSVHELGNTTLLGPVPLGDDRHNWTGEEFGNLI
jgi:hypothetical protein